MKSNRRSRRVRVTVGSETLLSSAGAALLLETARTIGWGDALSERLSRWRPSRGRHDPGKVVLDLAVAIALGGDCLADLGVVRAQPDLFGQVASDPTVSRLIATLAADAPAALDAVRTARAGCRERVWRWTGPVPAAGPIIVDLDATIVLAHSEKQGATPTWKPTFEFHPLLAFVDHGLGGVGEPVGGLLRTGKATANDAGDHITVLTDALAQIPAQDRSRGLVRGVGAL